MSERYTHIETSYQQAWYWLAANVPTSVTAFLAAAEQAGWDFGDNAAPADFLFDAHHLQAITVDFTNDQIGHSYAV